MAHHLAEVMHEAEIAEETDKDRAQQEAINLILELWSHRRDLPGSAYPLKNLEPVLSIIRRLSPKASPYGRNRADDTEELLSRVFDALQVVVIRGVVLTSKTTDVPDDLDVVDPFLDQQERRVVEAVQGWLEFINSEPSEPQVIVQFSGDDIDTDSTKSEISESDKLDQISGAKKILCEEIDSLIETLSDLKTKINVTNAENNGED